MWKVEPSLLENVRQRFSDLDHLPIGLAVLDAGLNVLYWNVTLENWTGVTREKAVGRSLALLNPLWSEPHYTSRLSLLFEGGPPVVFSPLLHPKIVPVAQERGQSFHVIATAVPDSGKGWWAFLSVEDVTVLSRRIEELRLLRTQQDRMMREIHHRVKNNLNMISGMISLQKNRQGNDTGDAPLHDLQSRIVAISEIHDLLYHSSSLSVESAAEYLESLAILLDQNLSISRNHTLILELDRSVAVKTDTTVLLGLVQAELMTNALKYGLGRQENEVLKLWLVRIGPKTCELGLSHTGDWLPKDFDPATSTGLGMVLLTAYAAQLGTTLGWSKGDPTRFWLRFAG